MELRGQKPISDRVPTLRENMSECGVVSSYRDLLRCNEFSAPLKYSKIENDDDDWWSLIVNLGGEWAIDEGLRSEAKK